MNPFYSYSHNHLAQFSASNDSPSPSITPSSSSSATHNLVQLQQQQQQQQQQHQQQQQQQQHHQQQHQHAGQFMQSPQSASVVAAAASFYARNTGQDTFATSRRHMQGLASPIQSTASNSLINNNSAASPVLFCPN